MAEREKSSPHQFYQFWLKVADADVYKFQNDFTFLSIEEIDAIEAKDKASGSKPEAQRILAEEMTRLIHGEAALPPRSVFPKACLLKTKAA